MYIHKHFAYSMMMMMNNPSSARMISIAIAASAVLPPPPSSSSALILSAAVKQNNNHNSLMASPLVSRSPSENQIAGKDKPKEGEEQRKETIIIQQEGERSAEDLMKEDDGLGEAPEKPLPGDCCGSGCVRCVWDIYFEELEVYNAKKSALENARKPSS